MKQKAIPNLVWIAGAALVCAALVASLLARSRPDVAVIEVQPREATQILAVVGRAKPVEVVDVRPQTAGTIVRLLVDEGDTVATGQIIAEMDAGEQDATVLRARAEADGRQADAAARRGDVSGRQADVARLLGEVAARRGEVAQRESDLAARRADVVRLQADLAGRNASAELARASLGRTQTLHERGFASDAALDAARAGAASARAAAATAAAAVQASRAVTDAAEAAVRTARSGVAAAEAGVLAARASAGSAASSASAANASVAAAQAGVTEAASRAGRLVLRAPLAGVVLSRPVDPGQFADAQTVVFRIGAGGRPEVEAEVDEADADGITLGMTAILSPTGSSARLAAQVSEISPQINTGTGGRIIRFVPDGTDVALPPGRTIDINVILAKRTGALLVPRAALVGGEAVLVVQNGRTVRQAVSLLDWPGEQALVERGLKAGDLVVRAPEDTRPGTRVRPVVAAVPPQ